MRGSFERKRAEPLQLASSQADKLRMKAPYPEAVREQEGDPGGVSLLCLIWDSFTSSI